MNNRSESLALNSHLTTRKKCGRRNVSLLELHLKQIRRLGKNIFIDDNTVLYKCTLEKLYIL